MRHAPRTQISIEDDIRKGETIVEVEQAASFCNTLAFVTLL